MTGRVEEGKRGDTTRPEDWILVVVVLKGYTTENGVWIGGGGGSVYHRPAFSLPHVSLAHILSTY